MKNRMIKLKNNNGEKTKEMNFYPQSKNFMNISVMRRNHLTKYKKKYQNQQNIFELQPEVSKTEI